MAWKMHGNGKHRLTLDVHISKMASSRSRRLEVREDRTEGEVPINMVHGGMTLVKYVLFLFNFIFWLSGIAIIVTGAVIQIKWTYYMNFLGDTVFAAPILLIIIGCIIAFLGFFGCCGAIRENYCMTMTFAVLLGILFILELAGGIAGYVLRDELDKIVRANALEGMLHYENTTELNLVTKAWDQMQVNYECCGVSDYTDWQNNTMFQGEYSVPLSCCRVDECKGIIRDTPPDLLDRWIWTNGCADLLGQYAEQKVGEISGIICGIAVIQILGISLACCLSKSILKDYEDYYY